MIRNDLELPGYVETGQYHEFWPMCYISIGIMEIKLTSTALVILV